MNDAAAACEGTAIRAPEIVGRRARPNPANGPRSVANSHRRRHRDSERSQGSSDVYQGAFRHVPHPSVPIILSSFLTSRPLAGYRHGNRICVLGSRLLPGVARSPCTNIHRRFPMNRRVSRREWFRGLLGAAFGTVAAAVATKAPAASPPIRPKSSRRTYSYTDAVGYVTTTTIYDSHGRVIASCDPLGNRVSYTYDASSILRSSRSTADQTPPSMARPAPSGCGATGA